MLTAVSSVGKAFDLSRGSVVTLTASACDTRSLSSQSFKTSQFSLHQKLDSVQPELFTEPLNKQIYFSSFVSPASEFVTFKEILPKLSASIYSSSDRAKSKLLHLLQQ